MSDFHRGVIDGIVITHHPKVSEDEATPEVPEMLLSRVSLYVRGLPEAHVDFFDDGFASFGDLVLGRTVAMTGRLDRHHHLVTKARKADILALQPSPSNGCFLVPTVETTTAGAASSSTFDLISGQWSDSMAVAVERYFKKTINRNSFFGTP